MKNGVIVIMSLEALKENTSSVVFFFYTTILTILTRLLRLGDSYSRNK